MADSLIVAGLLAVTGAAIVLLGVLAGLDRAGAVGRHREPPRAGSGPAAGSAPGSVDRADA